MNEEQVYPDESDLWALKERSAHYNATARRVAVPPAFPPDKTDIEALTEHFGGPMASWLVGDRVGQEYTNHNGQRFRKYGEGDWRRIEEADTPAAVPVFGHEEMGHLYNDGKGLSYPFGKSPKTDTPAVVPSQEACDGD